jgi:hypothetical protein
VDATATALARGLDPASPGRDHGVGAAEAARTGQGLGAAAQHATLPPSMTSSSRVERIHRMHHRSQGGAGSAPRGLPP